MYMNTESLDETSRHHLSLTASLFAIVLLGTLLSCTNGTACWFSGPSGGKKYV